MSLHSLSAWGQLGSMQSNKYWGRKAGQADSIFLGDEHLATPWLKIVRSTVFSHTTAKKFAISKQNLRLVNGEESVTDRFDRGLR